MKKLILSSAAVLFISISVFANTDDKNCKQTNKNCSPKECVKDANGKDKNCEFAPNQKCSKDKTKCHTDAAKKDNKKVD